MKTILSVFNTTEWNSIANPPDVVGGMWVAQIIVTMVSFFGVCSSSVLFYAIFRDEKLRENTANHCIMIMAATDIGMSVIGVIFSSVVVAEGCYPGVLPCQIQGIMYPTLAMSTFSILLVLTYERFRKIVENKQFLKRQANKAILGLVAVVTVWSMVPVLSGNSFGMNELSATGTLCIVQGGFGLIQYDLVVGINVIFFATVLSAMIFWYSKIYFHLKAVFSKAKNPKEDKGVNIERQILIQFLVITLFFLGCWACLALMWALATFGFKIYSDWYETFAQLTCHLNSAMNPIIYGVMNKKLRAAMFGIAPEWMSLPKLKSSVKPSSQDSSMEEGGASKASTEGSDGVKG